VVEGGCEDDVGDFEFALDELLKDAEAVEAGHLDVEEDEIGGMLFDEGDGFKAVFALADEGDFGEGFEEEGEFLAGGFFVVDNDGVDGHGEGEVYSGRWPATSEEGEWEGRKRDFTTEDTEGTEKRKKGFYRRDNRGATRLRRIDRGFGGQALVAEDLGGPSKLRVNKTRGLRSFGYPYRIASG
jgi:hypothetical protein